MNPRPDATSAETAHVDDAHVDDAHAESAHAETAHADGGPGDGASTESTEPPTGVSQLAQILAAGELAPTVSRGDEAGEHGINWRWLVGIGLTVAALALAASVVLMHNITPLIRTAGCDLMSRSTSCPASQ